ncbi:hypothetical protein M422DRAFT_27859 [Sphaerobolus stellatus SS14]|nr:hypothetical protein M422DRAFT_27859 [Sphaerobolus stellatus SS14]
MAGLERLVPLIYHEKQQSGSQLCAQHALNTVLQGDYFQAPDLAQFAHQLDALEGAVNEDAGPDSNNMDDTGFFSVGVLEHALRVWGFTLVRWRSEELREQQANPHHQMAFILNHQQHWFSLRRFGNLEDPENGHWFNLNSFLQEPEWVGKLYLGMVLSQAEDEGYSVFAVIPVDEPGSPETLPRTDADDVASTLPQPTSSGTGVRISIARTQSTSNTATSKPLAVHEGFEDEDMELQAALQASLAAGGDFDYAAFSELPQPPRADPSVSAVAETRLPEPEPEPEAEVDSIEANMARNLARNRQLMARMRQEQEEALREQYEGEVARTFAPRGVPRGPRIEVDDDEDENIRRAIEASRAEHVENPDAMEEDDDDGDWLPPRRATEAAVPVAAPARDDRVYDDEDAELQAALRASLEALPEGFTMPITPPRETASLSLPVQSTSNIVASPNASIQEEEEEIPQPAAQLDPDELRKRRLARFGGQ